MNKNIARLIATPERLYVPRWRITCPECKGESHIFFEWLTSVCPHCGADLGGCNQRCLKAEEIGFEIGGNLLTGEPVILEMEV